MQAATGAGSPKCAKERAMPAVSNKTQMPMSVPLPGGKTLHLGPGKTGQVSAKAVEDPRLKKLVEAGELEVVGDDERPVGGSGGGKRGRGFMVGHTSGSGSRRSGDR
jgi:hypothetical protein